MPDNSHNYMENSNAGPGQHRTMKNRGIAVAGTMSVDMLYKVQGLPKPGELSTIKEEVTRSCGGALCNVITGLAVMDPSLPLTALGRLGTDAEGGFILSMLGKHRNIGTSHIRRGGATCFTAVMADIITKQRSFFQYRGANALFSEDDIDWDSLEAGFLHIGYILLLDALDAPDREFGTKMARLLFHAQERGIKTSVDVVSENGDRFRTIVPPALKYTDYCVINEFEAEKTTGVPLRDAGNSLALHRMPEALGKLMASGVSTWAVIHAPEGGFALDASGNYEEIPGLCLPEGYIQGTVGAGDAFCTGIIYGAYTGLSLRESLELGTAAAVCCLSGPGAVEGLRPAGEALAFYRKMREG